MRRALLVALVLVHAASTRAQPTTVDVELGVGLGDSGVVGSSTGLVPRLGLRQPLGEGTLIVQWGLMFASTEAAAPLDGTGLALENPVLGYAFALGPDLRLTPLVALPVATVTEDAQAAPSQTVAFNLARGTDGMRQIWRSLPDNASAVLLGELTLDLDGLGALRTSAALGVAVPTSDLDPDVDALVDLGLEWRPLPEVFVELGLASVPTSEGDHTQLSLRPGVELRLGADFLLRAAARLNFGAPYDSFEDGVLGFEVGLRMVFGSWYEDVLVDEPMPSEVSEPAPDEEPADEVSSPEPTRRAGGLTAALERIVPGWTDGFAAAKGAVRERDASGLSTTWEAKVCPAAASCRIIDSVTGGLVYLIDLGDFPDLGAARNAFDAAVAAIERASLPFALDRLAEEDSFDTVEQGFGWLEGDEDFLTLLINVMMTKPYDFQTPKTYGVVVQLREL